MEPQRNAGSSYPYNGGRTPQDSYPPTMNSNSSRTMVNHPYDPQRPARSPSPSPSELEELSQPLYDFSKYKSKTYWLRWKAVPYYILFIVIVVLFSLLYIYHKQIVSWLTPAATWMKNLPFGFLIPIAIFFVISFPPLFGHEILAIICGLVWGLWIGFAIVCAGTFVGEIGNFYAFRYCCRARAEKMEKTKPYYACLARVVRDGGFKIALIARLSAIPGHFTTAIFSTCGMSIFTFCLAAVLSLPKQFVTVYLGVLLDSNGATETTGQKIASDAVAGVSIVITFVALWYIYREMQRVRPIIIREKRRRERQAAFATSGPDPLKDAPWDGTNPRQPVPMRATSPANSAESTSSDAPLREGAAPMGAMAYGPGPYAPPPPGAMPSRGPGLQGGYPQHAGYGQPPPQRQPGQQTNPPPPQALQPAHREQYPGRQGVFAAPPGQYQQQPVGRQAINPSAYSRPEYEGPYQSPPPQGYAAPAPRRSSVDMKEAPPSPYGPPPGSPPQQGSYTPPSAPAPAPFVSFSPPLGAPPPLHPPAPSEYIPTEQTPTAHAHPANLAPGPAPRLDRHATEATGLAYYSADEGDDELFEQRERRRPQREESEFVQ